MKLAQRLAPGDTIAVCSPSSPATVTAQKRYLRGKKYLEEKGYRVMEGALTGKQDHYRSGSIAARVAELNALIQNPEVKCIMAAIGGMNANALLPYVDYKTLRENPKIIVGYSDFTALLLGIYAQTGIPTFYGPAVVASFGELPPYVDQTFAYFADVAAQAMRLPHRLEKPECWTEEFINWDTQDRAKTPVENSWLTLHGGKAQGRLIGGNLNTMGGIWGSPYMPEILPGDILLLEDSLKDAATVERSFAFLGINGVFDKIGGLILGKHELFDDCGTGRKPHEILLEVMGQPKVPVLAGFDCCHTHPMFTMPLGCKVELDADAQTVSILEQAVC